MPKKKTAAASKASSPQRKALTIPFEPEELVRFSALCDAAGISMSELIRTFVAIANVNGVAGEITPCEEGPPELQGSYERREGRRGIVTLEVPHPEGWSAVGLPFLMLKAGGVGLANANDHWYRVGTQFELEQPGRSQRERRE